MAPKKQGKGKRKAKAQELDSDNSEEWTAEQMRYVVSPYFQQIDTDVLLASQQVTDEQGVGGNHACVNLAKKEMMRLNLEKAELGDHSTVVFLGGLRAPHPIF